MIIYKDTTLERVSSSSCFQCYFLGEHGGCTCPRYLECSPTEIYREIAPTDPKKVKKDLIAEFICHEV